MMIEEQLERWQRRGFEVALNTTASGKWYCAIATPGWFMRDPSPERAADDMSLKFVTEPCNSPQSAVEAALKVIQP